MTDNINGPVLSASLDELKYLVFEGMQGEQGVPGPQGAPGADGDSPTVSVTPITGGHRVTITDADGDHEFNVMDGTDGSGLTGATLLYYLPAYGSMQWYAHPGDESLTDITGAEISDLVLEDGRAVFAYEPGTQRIYQLERLPDNMGSTAWFVCWTQNEVSLLEMTWSSAAVTKSNVTPQRLPNHSGAVDGSVLKVIESGGSKYLAWGSVPAELPSGGTAGQVLKKTASGVAWANESGGSGSGTFVIPISYDGTDYTTTATAAEMIAHKNDLAVECQFIHYSLKSAFSSEPDSYYTFYFSCEYPQPSRIDAEWFRIECSNGAVTITAFSKDIPLLPTVSASDNGKFLRVVSGAWAAASVPSAEGASF